MARIAIVGMACRYPDARSPAELWENVLAQRRAFRHIPSERLRSEDYFSKDPNDSDHTYSLEAALIEGYEFDRLRFRVSGSTFRCVDMAHWLALDVASQALEDAGFPDGLGLPQDTTGVLLGNTLTGEFSRANQLRLRWPYVYRVVDEALRSRGSTGEERRAFLASLEVQYKAPFPPVSEETLAGSLSNTIAGRICNHFDLKGGGYTVDGACAASLVAVAEACQAIAIGDLEVALAGGVDLSLDPFELVGFARMGALAASEMRVYDVASNGFWPGEGCGFVVLMDFGAAVMQRRRIYAVIRGWGISSDGSGGITRPEMKGQLLALRRAYRRAGFGIETVEYVEGHGTGTGVGDTTELRTICHARREAGPEVQPATIGSIKANIGHTKAAAGVAGLIKAALAVHEQVLPPTTGVVGPARELTNGVPTLRVLREAEPWPVDRHLRAGVSAMGFGGINAHVVLEGITAERHRVLNPQQHALSCSAQDAELLLLGARDRGELQQQLERLAALARGLSCAELGDLAAQTQTRSEACGVRAAIVASTPTELASRAEELLSRIAGGLTTHIDAGGGTFLGESSKPPRIGLVFPGQGAPVYFDGGALRRRFDTVRELYRRVSLPPGSDATATEGAQPAIVLASLAAIRLLSAFRIAAAIAVGHSLGELTALHWAGAIDEQALLRIATARGQAMASLAGGRGTMVSVAAGRQEVEVLLGDSPVVIAGLNSPRQTVISGEASAVSEVVSRAALKGVRTVVLPVRYAFHSPLVKDAAPALAQHLARENFAPLQRAVVSTVTGRKLPADVGVKQLLFEQLTAPVRFMEAMAAANSEGVDLWIEAGPGALLTGLLSDLGAIPAVAIDAGGLSLRGMLAALGAAFALGAEVDAGALFAGRFVRPFDLNRRPRFFANPCESAPVAVDRLPPKKGATESGKTGSVLRTPSPVVAESPLELVRKLVAARAELPPSAVKDEHRLLSDLHLNSITVGELVTEASRRISVPLPLAVTGYTDGTVAEIARALEDQSHLSTGRAANGTERYPQGVDAWVRVFTVEMVEQSLPRPVISDLRRAWRVIAPPSHPLRDRLEKLFPPEGRGTGVVVCLSVEPDEGMVDLLLEGARAALRDKENGQFIVVQPGQVGGAFARCLYLEAPEITTCVVRTPLEHAQAADWVLAEAVAARGYSEAQYDDSGRRTVPVLRALSDGCNPVGMPLGPGDVLLVTGGGKGIAAECALALARETVAALVLLGRSEPGRDPSLQANLERIQAAGVRFRYFSVDVTDEAAVAKAVRQAQADLGSVTAVLHAAGRNVPCLLSSLNKDEFLQTLAPKVQGLCNVLAAVDPGRLRLLVTFGSLIARTGLQGEAAYALANEWLRHLTENWQAKHPRCRGLTVEWSVWSGLGMGERLGKVDELMRRGVAAISAEEGIGLLRGLLWRESVPVSVVVTGRFGDHATLRLEPSRLPFRRFLEKPRLHYAGVELVADAELSSRSDPYLDEHIFRGERVLPAVLGLEAMAQVAVALAETEQPPVFENVKFARPVVIPGEGTLMIRVAALKRQANRIDVVLRCESTALQVNHFEATCCFPKEHTDRRVARSEDAAKIAARTFLPLDPGRELYSGILFQRGRFQRIRGYKVLKATECFAEIAADTSAGWFGPYLPGELVLGDPGARDAVIHAIQACIPHAVVLPVAVNRLEFTVGGMAGPCFVRARERARNADGFTYDVEVVQADGTIRERWEGLKLQQVEEMSAPETWVVPLLGPYVERWVGELMPRAGVTVAMEWQPDSDGRSRADGVIQRAAGTESRVFRRADGKPFVGAGCEVSASHARGLTLAVAGPTPLGCDLEPVTPRPVSVWRDLLAEEGSALANQIAKEKNEDFDTAATRVWCAIECLKKAGVVPGGAAVLVSCERDGWLQLAKGPMAIATLATRVQGMEKPLVLAVLAAGTGVRFPSASKDSAFIVRGHAR